MMENLKDSWSKLLKKVEKLNDEKYQNQFLNNINRNHNKKYAWVAKLPNKKNELNGDREEWLIVRAKEWKLTGATRFLEGVNQQKKMGKVLISKVDKTDNQFSSLQCKWLNCFNHTYIDKKI